MNFKNDFWMFRMTSLRLVTKEPQRHNDRRSNSSTPIGVLLGLATLGVCRI